MRLRPSMRENYRYILIRFTPEKIVIEGLDLFLAVSDAVISLYGDLESARMWPSVMEVTGHQAIIRCRRETVKELETALATITEVGGEPVAVHPVCTSGTIKTLREKRSPVCSEQTGRVVIDKVPYDCIFLQGGRIDLKEKGINLGTPRYITEEDTEERYYDE